MITPYLVSLPNVNHISTESIKEIRYQIMFPGRFNDILKADEHYIALAPDFSNIDDFLSRFRDPTFRQAMADRSYEYVLDQHTYTHRLSSIRKCLD